MLTSLAATQAPRCGQAGQQANVAGQPVAALVEGAEEREVRAHRARRVQPATTSDWPAATRGGGQHGRWPGPTPKADSAGAARRARVRCPPTSGHVIQRAGVRACRAAPPARGPRLPTIVSTMPERSRAHGGQVVDVGEHRGDAGAVGVVRPRSAGSRASPQAMTCPSPAADAAAVPGTGRTAPSSPGPCSQLPPPNTWLTSPICALARSAEWRAQVARQLLEPRARAPGPVGRPWLPSRGPLPCRAVPAHRVALSESG